MSLLTLTAESLSESLDVEVPDNYVIVAKHSVMGVANETISEVLGCSESDINELAQDPVYQQVRAVVAVQHSALIANQSAAWDELERIYLGKLIERAPHEKDSDFLIRGATMANRAQRKTLAGESKVLDPTSKSHTVAITLTQRLVKTITRGESSTEEQSIRKLSITDGSMERCTSEEVDSLLGINKSDPTLEELIADVQEN